MEATQDGTRFTPEYNNLVAKFRNKVKDVIKERGIRAAQLEQELFESKKVDAKNGLIFIDTMSCYNDVIREHYVKLENKASKKRGN